MSIEQAQTRLAERVMRLQGVVGIAIGRCGADPCFKVYVVQKSARLAAEIPSEFEGYRVELEESGDIRALDSNRT